MSQKPDIAHLFALGAYSSGWMRLVAGFVRSVQQQLRLLDQKVQVATTIGDSPSEALEPKGESSGGRQWR